MPLHRYVDPSYFLGVGVSFPGTIFGTAYDRINVTSGGTGSGGSANADGAKSGGSNAGTYFVAFGEDATSSFFNRANRALSENTDFLDDVVNADLVQLDSVSAVSAGDANLDINASTDPIYVGSSYPDTFVVVKTSDGEPLYDPTTGTRITVTNVTNSGGTPVAGPTYSTLNPLRVVFSHTIGSGINYTVRFGRRRSVVRMDETVVSSRLIPSAPLNNAYMQSVLRGGLDARYRNATTAGTAALDTSGAGAIITRDGPAPAVDVSDPTDPFLDPIGACWKAYSSHAGGAGGFTAGESTGIGFVHYCGDRATNEAQERGAPISAGSFVSVWPRTHVGDFAGSVKTQINPSRAATLNPGGANAAAVELNASDFLYETIGGTSIINTGFDLLEITRASGDIEVYVITYLDSDTRAQLRDLNNEAPVFPADEAVTCRLLTLRMWQGPCIGTKTDTAFGPYSDSILLGGFVHQVPPTNDHSNQLPEVPPFFSARDNTTSNDAFRWGGYHSAVAGGYAGIVIALASTTTYGSLRGDGSIRTAGHSSFGLYNLIDQNITVNGTGSSTWNIHTSPRLDINVTVAGATLTLGVDAMAYTPVDGDQIEIVVHNQAAATSFTILWPTVIGFLFSSSADKTPSQGANSVTKYTGTYSSNAGGFLMTKTAYGSGGVSGP